MRSVQFMTSAGLPFWPAAVLTLCLACGTDSTAPAEQTPLIPTGTAQAPIASADVAGSGGVSVTTKPIPDGYFDATIAVHVVNARPSTTYVVQRAPEVGRALGADGICQRALGLAPWSSADPAAPTFVVNTGIELRTFTGDNCTLGGARAG